MLETINYVVSDYSIRLMVAQTLQVKKNREFKDIAIETPQKGTQRGKKKNSISWTHLVVLIYMLWKSLKKEGEKKILKING